MRREPSVLHVDLDSFFASVEQRDKPSLRGKPVVVGGVGPRGVVATASYEARAFGIHSAMATGEARRRCPHAAFLAGRFAAYRAASDVVMGCLRELSPMVEPLSLDEAFVDLAAADGAAGPAGTEGAGGADLSVEAVTAVATALKLRIRRRTALTASVGAASSKLLAKIASDLDKPDGLVVVAPGEELAVLHPLPVSRLWGVGPVTAQRLARLGVTSVGELAGLTEDELVGSFGQAHGRALFRLARADDDRPVVTEREAKSVGVEETFATDLTDPARLRGELDLLAVRAAGRLRTGGHSARTVTVKIRLHDFRTLSRSTTLPAPTDDSAVLRRLARALLAEVDVSGGVRLLGVALSGLSDHVQHELPHLLDEPIAADRPGLDDVAGDHPVAGGSPAPAEPREEPAARRFAPGADVVHDDYGPGWVQGSGVGRVTVRFETAHTGPGTVRTFALDDPRLVAAAPAPYVDEGEDSLTTGRGRAVTARSET